MFSNKKTTSVILIKSLFANNGLNKTNPNMIFCFVPHNTFIPIQSIAESHGPWLIAMASKTTDRKNPL